ncbi:MAG: hypothetical protein LBC87_05325 [Fibromonadaceae bacterium]|nr:hypothetical protein [Fibromonadaceae bacterium]
MKIIPHKMETFIAGKFFFLYMFFYQFHNFNYQYTYNSCNYGIGKHIVRYENGSHYCTYK